MLAFYPLWPSTILHLMFSSYTLNNSLLRILWSFNALLHMYLLCFCMPSSLLPKLASPVWNDKNRSMTLVKVAMTVKQWSASLVLIWVAPLFRLTVVGQQLCLLPFLYAGGAQWSIQRKTGYVFWIQVQGPFYLWTGQCLLLIAVSVLA